MGAIAKVSEREVTAQIRDFLSLKGWRAVRMQRTIVPGQFQTGEPGIPDFLFLRYLRPGLAAGLWVELKRPGARQDCRCHFTKGNRLCTLCAQRKWRENERSRGALVWRVENLEVFMHEYERVFGWLHDGRVEGQIEMFMGQNQR